MMTQKITLSDSIAAGDNWADLSLAFRSCTKRVAAKIGDEAGWGLLFQFILLWFFRKRKRKWAQRFELLTLAISVPDALSVVAVSSLSCWEQCWFLCVSVCPELEISQGNFEEQEFGHEQFLAVKKGCACSCRADLFTFRIAFDYWPPPGNDSRASI